ncbi:hypothetical protein SprV_0200797800 [Sparganum proliferum]
MARLMLESWSSTGTLNRAIDLHPAYQVLRVRLESVQAGPVARMKKSQGVDCRRREGKALTESHVTGVEQSHGRTHEAGNTTLEEQRSISPPSDEGEANEHADAAATTSGVRETRQSANGWDQRDHNQPTENRLTKVRALGTVIIRGRRQGGTNQGQQETPANGSDDGNESVSETSV